MTVYRFLVELEADEPLDEQDLAFWVSQQLVSDQIASASVTYESTVVSKKEVEE